MLRVICEVDVPSDMAQGAKETIAMDLERYGDTRVVEVQEYTPEQLKMGE